MFSLTLEKFLHLILTKKKKEKEKLVKWMKIDSLSNHKPKDTLNIHIH